MLRAVQSVHKYGYIYWDIKPENFVLSQNEDDITLVDYGLCHSVEEIDQYSEDNTERMVSHKFLKKFQWKLFITHYLNFPKNLF